MLLQGGEGRVAIRNRRAREQMKKRVGKETKPYCWKLGYNHCVGQYQTSDEYPNLSGSSINRRVKKKEGARLFLQLPKKVEYQEPHFFSKRSRGKVKDKATAFWRACASKDNRSFVTLTFIQAIPDIAAVKILNKFLTVLRKEKPGLEYLWVAEPQEDNDMRIHYHMLINRRLDIKRYNSLWVLQQYNAGLVAKRITGQVISRKEVQQRYDYDMATADNFIKKDPDSMMAVLNPFSIEKAYNIHALSNYLTTYITKQAKDHPFGCLAWHCSRKVSKLFIKEVVSPSTFRYMCSFGNVRMDKRTGEIKEEPVALVKPFFTMVYVLNKGAPLKFIQQLEKVNKWLMNGFDAKQASMLTDQLYRKIMINVKEEDVGTTLNNNRRLSGIFDQAGNSRRKKVSALQTYHKRRKKVDDHNYLTRGESC